MESYPLVLEGREAGRVELRREGLYTLVSAWAPGEKGLRRIWLKSREGSLYLGLMEPREEGLYLHRRLSRRELEALPGELIQAGEGPSPLGPEITKEPEPAPETIEGDRLWEARPDGSLVHIMENGTRLLALPASLRRMHAGLELREIEGRGYLIFRY